MIRVSQFYSRFRKSNEIPKQAKVRQGHDLLLIWKLMCDSILMAVAWKIRK